jgi:hypothetical protein
MLWSEEARVKLERRYSASCNRRYLYSEFGFSNEKIVAAIPDMNGLMESKIIKDYRETVKRTANILNTKELELPLIIKDEKVYKDLGKTYKQYLPQRRYKRQTSDGLEGMQKHPVDNRDNTKALIGVSLFTETKRLRTSDKTI